MNSYYDLTFNGKTKELTEFYEKYPWFVYKNFLNNNIKTEEECIKYILNNQNNTNVINNNITQLLTNINIYFAFCVNYKYVNLKNYDMFLIDNIKNEDMKIYNDKYTYLLVDSHNLNDNINKNYKIILYVNTDNIPIELIDKYNIEFFILDDINRKTSLLLTLKDYKLIIKNNDFNDAFFNIYNYKKKYENINNIINFEKNIDVEIIINVKNNKKDSIFMINNKNCEIDIKENQLYQYKIILININKIEIKNINCLYFNVKYRKINEKIEQLYLTRNLYKYKEDNRIHIAHNLKDYYDTTAPAFFYGIARKEDIDTIINHKGKKYIIFSGGDIDLLYHINKDNSQTKLRLEYCKKLQELDEIYYIPRSSFMINDMKSLFFNYKYIPFIGTSFSNFVPKPLGKKIYHYTYADNQKYMYGWDIINKIKKLKPEYEFLFLTHPNAYKNNIEYCKENNISTCETNEEIVKKYQECFISLRLTSHDGIANSVLECGLLGINTVYNDTKCIFTLSYNSIEDIINHIENEKKNIGSINYNLINKVKNHLNIPSEIYKTDYYD
jgi:hypothetical protein